MRPLLIQGLKSVAKRWYAGATTDVSLEHAYIAPLCGAEEMQVVLRPQLLAGEEMFYQHVDHVRQLVASKSADTAAFESVSRALDRVPHAILIALYEVLFNPLSGMHSLALGKLTPRLTPFLQ